MLRSPSTRLLLLACCLALLAPASASAAIGPLSSFGGFGEAAGKLRDPRGLTVGPESEIYVADEDNNRVDLFTASGAFVRGFGQDVAGPGANVCTSSCQAGPFDYPALIKAGSAYASFDVALDASGRVYLATPQLGRINVFTPAGTFLFAFGKEVDPGGGDRCDAASNCKEGEFDSGAGAFNDLAGIGISGASIYVADETNNRVDVFDLEGAFQFAFGRNVGGSGVHTCTTACQEGGDEGSAAIDNPVDVAFGPDGNVYVAYNGFTAGVAVFTAQGKYLRRFANNGGPNELEGPASMAIDPGGAVHVVDPFLEKVLSYSAAGDFLSSFAVGEAQGIALDCRGAFLITDGDSKVVRYGEPGTAPAPCPPPPPAVPIATVVPSNKFKFGTLKLNKSKGTATLTVNVPGPGKLMLKGNGLKKVSKSAKKAGNVKLAVKATGNALKKLNEKGKAALKAKLTFTPTGGAALTKPRTLVLKKTL